MTMMMCVLPDGAGFPSKYYVFHQTERKEAMEQLNITHYCLLNGGKYGAKCREILDKKHVGKNKANIQ